MAIDVTVLVVGAGPTGLLLAAELHRRGVACRLIDANRGAAALGPRDGRAPALARGLRVARHRRAVPRGAASKQRIARLHSAGDVLGEIDLAECGSRYGFNIGISEEVTESILTDYLHRQGGEVVRSSRLVGLAGTTETASSPRIEHDGVSGGVSAQWVVGCDGFHSATREFSGIELAGHDIPEPWAVFDATLPAGPTRTRRTTRYLDELPVILTALPERRWRVYLRPSSPDSDLVADAASTLRRYRPATALRRTSRTRTASTATRKWRRATGRAASCSPATRPTSARLSQGHGMNSGLQDAFNLAWKLALVCQGHSAHRAARQLRGRTAPGRRDDHRLGRRVRARPIRDRSRRTTRARRDAARRCSPTPTSRHHESIAEAELDIDYGDSPIVMGDAHAALAPGAAAARHDRGSPRGRRGLPAARADAPRRPHCAARRRTVARERRARATRRLDPGPDRRVAHRSDDRAHDAATTSSRGTACASRSRPVGRRRVLAAGHPPRRPRRPPRRPRPSRGPGGVPVAVGVSSVRALARSKKILQAVAHIRSRRLTARRSFSYRECSLRSTRCDDLQARLPF